MRTILLVLALGCGSPDSNPCALFWQRHPDGLMPSATIKAISGLHTSPNPYSKIPEGALEIADDVKIQSPGVLEPRNGMPNSAQSFAADRCFSLPNTRNAIVTSRNGSAPGVYNPDTDSESGLSRSGGTQPFGYPYQSDARTSVWGAAARGNLYLNGQQGIVAIPGNTSPTWRAAGLPRPAHWALIGLDATGVTAAVTMAINKRRTYRLTFAWYDPQGNFYESEPSEAQYIENTADYGGTGATATPIIAFYYPPTLPFGAFARLWRAPETAAGTQASEEFFLVREFSDPNQVASADGYASLNALSVTSDIYDVSVDSLLNVPLYTNPLTGTGTGLLGANTRPPAAAAVAWFKQHMYYGRTTFQQQIEIQIIGTGTGGVVAGDQVVIDGITYNAVSTADKYVGTPLTPASSASPTFAVATGLSAAQNIELTARRLADAINRYGAAYTRVQTIPSAKAGNPARQLYAYYASSGVNDFGRIVIMRPIPSPLTDDPGIAFSVVTTSAGIRFPEGNTTSADNYTPGGLSWSSFNEPESVPSTNFAIVGDPQKAVLGFAVLRDAMLILKEQEGVYILYDTGGPEPTIQLLDPSAVCISPQTIAVVNNAAYCLTAKGPVQVTEQSTQLVGEPIRDDLETLTFQNLNFEATAFGAAYEADRLYILGMPIGPSENSCSQQYVLNTQNGAWVRWTKAGATSAMMLPVQQKLLMTYSAPLPPGNVVTGWPAQGVYLERKGNVCSMDQTDLIGGLPAATYASVPLHASAAGSPPIIQAKATLTYAQDMHLQVFEGDLLLFKYTDADTKTRSQYARVVKVAKAVVSLDVVSKVSPDGTVLLTKAPVYYRRVPSHWRFSPTSLGEPTFEKQWNTTQYAFRYFDGDWLDVQLDTEKSGPPTGFGQVAADPQISNTSDTIDKVVWLRNVRDVILRLDPSWQRGEARGARLGMEFMFVNALARFQFVAGSAHAGEWKERATR